MKAARAKIVEEIPKRMPRFDGVPGQLVADDSLDSISFGAGHRRVSPYDALLDQLFAETKRSIAEGLRLPALRFDDARALASLRVRAKKKGFKIEFAETAGRLFVRLNTRELPASDEPGSRAENAFDAQLIGILKTTGPLNQYKIANRMRAAGNNVADGPMCEVACIRLTKTGVLVKREDGAFGLRNTATVYALNYMVPPGSWGPKQMLSSESPVGIGGTQKEFEKKLTARSAFWRP